MCSTAVIFLSLRAVRLVSSASASDVPANAFVATTTVPDESATLVAFTPPGRLSTRSDSPIAGSRHSAGGSSSSASRPEVNSSDPSGRNTGAFSPLLDRVSRRAGAVTGLIELPQRADELVAVVVEFADRGDQPRPVRGQGETVDAADREEIVERSESTHTPHVSEAAVTPA